MRKYAHIVFGCLFTLLIWGCGASDLSFINEVKRFEPHWMSLSEKSAKIQHNLSITRRRYPKDMDAIAPMIRKGGKDWAYLLSLKNQYSRVMSQRDSLEAQYQRKKEVLVKTVTEFNQWSNQLMKNKLDEDQARRQFEQYRQQQQQLEVEMDRIYTELIQNIESHNAILRRIAQALNLYNNFDIDPK
ncbi:MAG: hypothetical protein D6730_25480 [Bacteroidetes bacterium]|nr:MAG: hypothetical protein D6730_25480 [Bacteroidota bacterium]